MTLNADGTAACDVCGAPSEFRRLTVNFSSDGTTVRCDLCADLLEAGLIRPEIVDGERRYRQWSPDWKPGRLLPKVGG